MYCTKCGTKNEEGKEFCKKCGAAMKSSAGLNVSIPDSITIDTSLIQKLSKFQKMYYGGGVLTLLGSFLPWGNVNLGMGALMGGAGKGSFSIMSLGLFNVVTLLYILPLVALGYMFYQEVLLKKTVSVYFKSSFLAAFCLTTFSITFFVFLVASQLQSLMSMASGFSGGLGNGAFGMGIGLIAAFVGGALVTVGTLLSIKEQAKEK